ncbi:aminotransferase class I and II family protein [Mycolicibacterium hassiacum DSM 44199]|uniref:Aminotransferase class I and II family protein n=1 Tax=Mycolicibacterium hassiacum (strain DSM 44199 / CIP 105218 / JCM 12690 / 3849) TaxID=1122247 RepID=K5BGN3_MYCHD|nr:aminotransferase class I and II family protein [Mycolicibacterium hassiacum DSM 44199]
MMSPALHDADRTAGADPLATDPAGELFALALNENPFPPLPSVRAALAAATGRLNRYPEFLPERLRAVIAARLGLPEEQVVLGVGATGVIMQALHAVTAPGDTVVLTSPTFDGYPILARLARLRSVAVPLDAGGHHDLGAMADASRAARVVVLCRPHNPTGTVETAAEVQRFVQRVPADTVVLLDEAYAEFLPGAHRLDTAALIARHPNLVVVRTFSKAYGLAGLRVGYGFAAPELARRLWSMQLPFAIGTPALVAVQATYRAENELRQRIRMIAAERRHLRVRLRALGVSTTDSHANFVYLPPAGRCWRAVFDAAGLRVRHYADGGVRITVGTRRSSNAVLAAVAGRRGEPAPGWRGSLRTGSEVR